MKRRLFTLMSAALLILAVFVPSTDAKAATSKARMTRLEFVKETVKAVEGAVSGSVKTTVPVSASAAAKVSAAKEAAAGRAEAYAKKYDVSAEDAAYIAKAVSLGLITEKTFTNYGYYTKRIEAAKILVNADRLLYADLYDEKHLSSQVKASFEKSYFFAEDIYRELGKCITDYDEYVRVYGSIKNGVVSLYPDDTDIIITGDLKVPEGGRIRALNDITLEYIRRYRIADLDKVTTSDRDKDALVTAYALGFVTGSPTAYYRGDRNLDPMGKPYASTLMKMIAMLSDESLRCSFSDDWQMLRVSSKDRPRWEKYYPYILDSFPNLYYDTSIPGMEYNLLGDDNWTYQMARPLEVREAELMEWNAYKQILTPKELKQVQDASKPWEYRMASQRMYSELYEFLDKALNTDYRTVGSDKEWQDVIAKYMGRSWMEDCMADIIKYHTVTECDIIAADPCGLGYSGWGYEGKAYVHFRVVQSDYVAEAIKAGGHKGISNAAQWMDERGYFLPFSPGKGCTEEVMAGMGVINLADFGYKIGEWTDLIVMFEGRTAILHPDDAVSVKLGDAGLDPFLMYGFTSDCTWLNQWK